MRMLTLQVKISKYTASIKFSIQIVNQDYFQRFEWRLPSCKFGALEKRNEK